MKNNFQFESILKNAKGDNKALICTLFTGQTSKEGIFMRYSYEFKLLCVDLYKSGIYPDTPNGTTDERFKKNVREWARMHITIIWIILRHFQMLNL